MSFTKLNCVVCLDNSDIYVSCPHCKEGNYCKECITKLVSDDTHKKCLICRRENWYNDDTRMQEIITANKEQKVEILVHSDVDNNNDINLDNNDINLDNNDIVDNNRLFSCEKIIKSLLAVLTLNTITFIGWLFLFNICKYEITSPNFNKDAYKFVLSLLVGLALFIICFIIILCIYKIYSCCLKTELLNCINIIMIILFLTFTILIGYYSTFYLCKLNDKYKENIHENNIIIGLISFSVGILIYVLILIAVIVIKAIYYCLREICGDDCADCICHPLTILVLLLISVFIIELGNTIVFEMGGANLNVKEENYEVIKNTIGLVVGYVIVIIAICLIVCCNYICCYKRNEISDIESDETEIV